MSTWKDFMNAGFGGAMEWNTKLLAHINANETNRVIDYLLSYLDYNDPKEFCKRYKKYKEGNNKKEDDLVQVEFEAVDYLKKNGYTLGMRYLVKHNAHEFCIFERIDDQSSYWHSSYYKYKND